MITITRPRQLNLVAVLLILLPVVGFSQPAPDLKPTFVSKEEAAELVVLSLPFYIPPKPVDPNSKLLINRLSVASLPSQGTELRNLLLENVTPVLDVDERVLFWDFEVSLKTGDPLRIRAAANTAIGTPVVSLAVGKKTDLEPLRALAEKVANALIPGLNSIPTLVMHSYPHYGLLYRTKNNKRVVIDLATLRLYDVRDASVRIKKWVPEVWSPFDRATLQEFKWFMNHFGAIVLKRRSITTIKFSICQPPENDLQRIEQEEYMWCAPATGQMILRFHEIAKSQDEIAVAMNTDLDNGTRIEDEVNGYIGLAPGFNVIYSEPPDFNQIQQEICANRPVRLGYSLHVVAVGGVHTSETTQQLMIFDPGYGRDEPYLEDWDTLMNSGMGSVASAPPGFYASIFLIPFPPP